jgi:hypothetical protein
LLVILPSFLSLDKKAHRTDITNPDITVRVYLLSVGCMRFSLGEERRCFPQSSLFIDDGFLDFGLAVFR